MRLLLAGDAHIYSGMLLRLMQANHYEADAVHTGPEALEYLLTGEYDGAIMDIELTGMDGVQVIRSVREAGVQVPILVLTARDGLDDMVSALDSGANDYLIRPFLERELLARIRVLTRSRTAQTTSSLHMGNLTLDRAGFCISTPFGSARLTRKEYQILELLLSNPSQRIPAERFLEAIWGYDGAASTSVLWVHLSYLRKKLRAVQADVQLRAIRNAGYMLSQTPTLQPDSKDL